VPARRNTSSVNLIARWVYFFNKANAKASLIKNIIHKELTRRLERNMPCYNEDVLARRKTSPDN
jgi:hypothetical protein